MKQMMTVVLALGVVTGSAPALAGDGNFTPTEEASSLVMVGGALSIAVVTAPVWLPVAGSMEAAEASERRADAKGRKTAAMKAGPLPPLTVEKVEAQTNGAVDVTLKHPESPERAVVQWPAWKDNPGAAVKVGDVLDLTPTPAGSGWTVAKDGGEALAFLPTDQAAQNQASERW